MSQLTLVTGAGGFIGGQLVRDLSAQGIPVRAVELSLNLGDDRVRRQRFELAI